ncbi:hypothetical protein TNCV_4611591 [Trichonephila clavipes]|nr:hypothetical protein TNCV_4611591 [Trichonephila clavipes]
MEELPYGMTKNRAIHRFQPLKVIVIKGIGMKGMASIQSRYHVFRKHKVNHSPPLAFGSFVMREKGGNCLVPSPNYMVDALKLPNQAPRVSGESLQICMAGHCPDGTQHLFCWLILAIFGQSLALNGPIVDRRYLNSVFGHTEVTHNKLSLSSSTKYIVEPFWPLALVLPPFELLHRALTTIVFALWPISPPQSPSVLETG